MTDAALPYASQFGQDRFLDREVFAGIEGGTFVDIGAHDGIVFSNSLFFERARSWTGLCIEPNPAVFARLRQARRAECLACCIAPERGTVEFRQVSGTGEMLSGMAATYGDAHAARLGLMLEHAGGAERRLQLPAERLDDLLDARGIGEVHFLSLDTEGGELAILRSIDFTRRLFHALTVENNDGDPAFSLTLGERGFVPLVRLAVDTIYVNRRSPFLCAALRRRSRLLIQLGRVERRLRRFGIGAARAPRFPYKSPR